MILQRLAEHYDRIAERESLAPPGYSMQKVSFCLVLEADGQLNSIEDLRRLEGKSLRPRMFKVPGQGKPPGAGFGPCFLWDSPEYLLGFTLDPLKEERAPKAFEAFKAAHLALESAIALPEFSAVCSFLKGWTREQAEQHRATLTGCATNFGVFRIAGERRYVHEVVTRPVSANETASKERAVMCLISGVVAPYARLHEPAIKGVNGANTMGAKLVSFDKNAFTSYGADQGGNAPVSAAATFRYTNALNYLLDRNDRRTVLGDATVVYWADASSARAQAQLDVLAELLGGPLTAEETPEASVEDEERVQEARLLLSQLREGTAVSTVKPQDASTRFFMLGLSPNASRLSVRLWIEADAREARRRLSEHVQDVALKGGRDDRPLSIYRIANATGRAERDLKGRVIGYDTKIVSPQLIGELARSVLTGAPYPQSLLSTMIRRVRSDGEVAFARVSAIKAVLVRNSRLRGAPQEIPVELDTQQTDVAYRCGRIFALLEKAQLSALGKDLNSTIKDRFLAVASATPAVIFPRLLRLNTHHLAKLTQGSRSFYTNAFGALMAEPFTFPRQLSLEQQGRFFIGYFQERQYRPAAEPNSPEETVDTDE